MRKLGGPPFGLSAPAALEIIDRDCHHRNAAFLEFRELGLEIGRLLLALRAMRAAIERNKREILRFSAVRLNLPPPASGTARDGSGWRGTSGVISVIVAMAPFRLARPA
jgi:hypothetical protein